MSQNTTPDSQVPPSPGQPHPSQQPQRDGRETLAPIWRWARGLGITRSSDRWVGGVAGGVATRLGLDPLLVRGLFVVAAMLGGVGFIAYAIAWALLPEPDGRIHAEEAVKGTFDQADLGIVVFLLIGLDPFDVGSSGAWVWGIGKGLGWIALITLAVWLWSQHRPTSGGAQPGPAQPGAPSSDPSGTSAASGTTGDPSAPGGTPESPAPAASGPVASFATAAGVHDAGFGPAAPPAAVAAPRPPKPPKAPKPRTAPNPAYVASVVGLAGIAAAALLIADRTGAISVSALLVLAVVLGVLGLGIVLAGLAGRRGGLLSLLAVVGLIAVPAAANSALGWEWDTSGVTVAGTADWTPVTAREASDGLKIVAGHAEVDLTQIPLPPVGAEPVTVPVHVTAGDAVITVPEGVSVLLDVDVFAGSADWDVDGVSGSANDGLRSQASVPFGPDGEPRLVIDLSVGAGDATIQGAAS
ncbi:MAG: PspC domain-containing protein [Salana multivorans]|nr:PspC domain-containing protein [Salana multivorans]